jgi:TonB family protein
MKIYWYLALILSLAIHAFILSGSPWPFNKRVNLEKEEVRKKEIEIRPEKIEKIVEKKEPLKDRTPVPPPQYTENLIERVTTKNQRSTSMHKPVVVENGLKVVALADFSIDEELKNNPAYMDYYKLIREKIRKNAYYYYNTNSKGEVSVHFAVANNGRVDSLLLNDASTLSRNLKDIAIKSVRDAAPFPPFPPELQDYSRLSFNVSIYFKNN